VLELSTLKTRSRARGEAQVMRLVAWNCNMALHRKVDALLSLQ
jgi:hypothetical protein